MDPDEDEVGGQVDLGQAGHEAEREPAEHEQDRIRDPQLNEHEHPRPRRQQHEQADDRSPSKPSPLSRSPATRTRDFSSARPIPRRISGVFENWMSA